MRNVHAFTSSLLSSLPKLNVLVLSSAAMDWNGYSETKEGIDKKQAIKYYARWKIANDLAPLLDRAADAGEEARVMFIAGAGQPGMMIESEEDLDWKRHYEKLSTFRRSMIAVQELFVEVRHLSMRLHSAVKSSRNYRCSPRNTQKSPGCRPTLA